MAMTREEIEALMGDVSDIDEQEFEKSGSGMTQEEIEALMNDDVIDIEQDVKCISNTIGKLIEDNFSKFLFTRQPLKITNIEYGFKNDELQNLINKGQLASIVGMFTKDDISTIFTMYVPTDLACLFEFLALGGIGELKDHTTVSQYKDEDVLDCLFEMYREVTNKMFEGTRPYIKQSYVQNLSSFDNLCYITYDMVLENGQDDVEDDYRMYIVIDNNINSLNENNVCKIPNNIFESNGKVENILKKSVYISVDYNGLTCDILRDKQLNNLILELYKNPIINELDINYSGKEILFINMTIHNIMVTDLKATIDLIELIKSYPFTTLNVNFKIF